MLSVKLIKGWVIKGGEGTFKSPEGKIVTFTEYRRRTGMCDICGKPMDGHPECESCGILVGNSHLEWTLVKYRGHKLCSFCRARWISMEKILKRNITFKEMVEGIPILGRE
jgi:hypothetical protein